MTPQDEKQHEKIPARIPLDKISFREGFIAFYEHSGTVMSTSIGWQCLEEGDVIDWDAVNVAYDDWVAHVGLAPDWIICATGGVAPLTIVYGAEIGFDDFTEG